MFKRLYNQFIHRIAKKQIAESFNKGYYCRLDETISNRKLDHEFSIKKSIGKKVIFCPNEWQDPVFVTVDNIIYVSMSDNPMAVGVDVLTGQQVCLFADTYYPADARMIKTILKLDPFERWNMSVGRLSHMCLKWDSNGTKHELTHPDAILIKLIESGFYQEEGKDDSVGQ